MVTVISGSSSLLILGHWLKLVMVSFMSWPFTPGHPFNSLDGLWGWSRSSGVERNFFHLPVIEPMIIQLIVYSVTKELAALSPSNTHLSTPVCVGINFHNKTIQY